MMFDRTIESTIKEKINGGKAIVVVGARQVGKTILQISIKKPSQNCLILPHGKRPTTAYYFRGRKAT